MALAVSVGAAASLEAPSGLVPLAGVLGVLLLIPVSTRPIGRLWIAAIAVAWAALGVSDRAVCLPTEGPGRAAIGGRFLAPATHGSAPFVVGAGCEPVTVVVPDGSPPVGVPVVAQGRWEAGRHRPWFRAHTVEAVSGDPTPDVGIARFRWAGVRWRSTLLGRIDRLYGEQAPLVAALTLARREGLDPDLRDRFARAGIAHLLAISGFHVGVLAAAALALLRLCRVPRRPARLGAALTCTAYVAFIGAPSAASRAGLIIVLAALSVSTGRKPARWGPLATALLVLLVADPSAIASPGFQLSFLGAGGLVAWSARLSAAIAGWTGDRLPRATGQAVAAGVAATVATLPAVAWHFEQVSLVGIPVTLLATPLVSTALPGAVLSLVLEPWLPGLAAFLAGGVSILLLALETGTAWIGGEPWASAWVDRTQIIVIGVGGAVGALVARHPRIDRRGRHRLMAVYAVCAMIAWPFWTLGTGWGQVTATVLDVGQGDAILLRSPRGRFILVDTGPPFDGDPRAHPVVRALRRRGVSRLDALVLTHPDADHIGGAADVLSVVAVRTVVDPALVVGKEEYAEVLATAQAHRVPWLAASELRHWSLDGLTLDVHHPVARPDPTTEANEASVVLLARLGDFAMLLTGDVGKEVEAELLDALEPVSVLKVGHHGSDTSTGAALLSDVRPEIAVISVGRRNRYGHPHPSVLSRLEAAGASVYRTDLHGEITVRGRADGRFEVSVERGQTGENRR